LSPASGQGTASIDAVISQNVSSRPRTAVVTINEQAWSLTQQGVPPAPPQAPPADPVQAAPVPDPPAPDPVARARTVMPPAPPAPSPPPDVVNSDPGNGSDDQEKDDGKGENEDKLGKPPKGK
jgi:hypothetical protein